MWWPPVQSKICVFWTSGKRFATRTYQAPSSHGSADGVMIKNPDVLMVSADPHIGLFFKFL